MSEPVHILVAYYSRRGSTRRLAEAVAAGAQSVAGTHAQLKRVEEVAAGDLLEADGLAVGSPVYFGTMAAAVKTFFEDWQFRFNFYPSRPLQGKVGTVFAAGGQGAGGRELAMLGMLAAMLHQWMIVLSGESPIGASAATECKPVPVDQHELAEARALGRRLAEVAGTLRMQGSGGSGVRGQGSAKLDFLTPDPSPLTPGAKIFGIGLSRTGTRSLAAALRLVGYRTADYVQHKAARLGQATWFAGDFTTDCLVAYDAAVDLPIPIFYPQLDRLYPGSRFILTVREPSSWIASVRRHWARWPGAGDPDRDYRQMVRLAMYGCHGFSEERMQYVHETHRLEVQRYFRDRPADLLVLDVCAGAGWDRLCPFLGLAVPTEPFPWLNKG